MKKFFFLLLLCIGVQAHAQYNVRIEVRNAQDSAVLPGSEIRFIPSGGRILTEVALTDSDGRAAFGIPTAKPYDLFVFREGYKLFSIRMEQPVALLVIYLKPFVYDGEEVTVSATRTGDLTVGTYTVLGKKDLEIRNFGQDLPVLLQNTPSAVTTSDAGAGIGYTGIRIRGIDPTRINVTVNGVPLNDAESQGVFWVNMPDFASGVENIQIQRGAGTSTIGTGAFGAAINIKTDKFSEKPYAQFSSAIGSFKTQRQTVKLGSGRMHSDWFTEARMSWIESNGFIDRASSDLSSWFLTAGKKTDKELFQINLFSGREKTYQAWNGVPMAKYQNDTAAIDSFVLWQWYDSTSASHLRLSDRYTYNYYQYPNETDNYTQSHIQFIYNRSMGSNRTLHAVIHGTLGKGYFENYKRNALLQDFVDTPVVASGIKRAQAHLIYQRWLDNRFAGFLLHYSVKHIRSEHLLGGAFNAYDGKHFGKVVWHEYMDLSGPQPTYYRNNSLKTDATLFWKYRFAFSKRLSAFSDVQVRSVYYSWYGPTASGVSEQQQTDYLFLNPKAGLVYQKNSRESMYLTLGGASREPIRDDFIQSANSSRPKPEFMQNAEAGYTGSRKDWKYTFTGFYMGYKDQLALTGKLNDVGGYTRVNIPFCYRAGIEAEAGLDINSWLNWSFNLAISRNKIKSFTEYIDDYTLGGQQAHKWENTNLALSPERVIGSVLTARFSSRIEAYFLTKYVSRQYLDNTQNRARSLDPYLINDLMIRLNPRIRGIRGFAISLLVNNLGNVPYASNGYSYSGIIHNVRRDFSFVYPQAGTNYMIKCDIGL